MDFYEFLTILRNSQEFLWIPGNSYGLWITHMTYVQQVHVQVHVCYNPSEASRGASAGRIGEEWKSKSASFREDLGIPNDAKPWTSRPQFVGQGISKTERSLDVIDCVAAKAILSKVNVGKSVKDIVENLFVDYTQSVERDCHTSITSGKNPCFTTKTELYSFSRDSIVLAVEMLHMHGYPKGTVIPRNVTPSRLKFMIGNGMSLPCVAVMIWSLHVTKLRLFEAPDDTSLEVHAGHSRNTTQQIGDIIEHQSHQSHQRLEFRFRAKPCISAVGDLVCIDLL